ncbi:MAG: pitrilysin family protein [Candidatus Paceibacterota bacterium]
MDGFQKTTLDSGLRVITVPMKHTQAVTVLVMVGAGAKYEEEQQNGLSHFLEHMFFKGTEKRGSTLELASVLDKVGGDYNAFTAKEVSGYWAKVDVKHLDLALDWVSDILLNSKFESEKIERERGVIIEELNMYLDTPMEYIGDLWEKLLYGDQPAGRLTIGTKENINNFSREQLLNYLSNHYLAENTVVCVAGDIKSKQAEKKISYSFEELKDEEAKDKPEVVEEQTKPQILAHEKDTDQTHMILGTRGYNLFDSERFAQSLLAIMLGGNMSSRLFIEVREKRGLCYYIKCSSETKTDSGYLAVKAGLDHNEISQAIDVILNEFKEIKQGNFSKSELQKAKDYLKGNTILNLESSDERAMFYTGQELLRQEILTPEEKFEKIDQVTQKDLQRVAQELFKPENLNLALIGPHQDEDEFKPLEL